MLVNGGMTLQRVVVTGMGTVNPLGHSVAETVATMDAGKIGILGQSLSSMPRRPGSQSLVRSKVLNLKCEWKNG